MPDPDVIYGANLLKWHRIDSLRVSPPVGKITAWTEEGGSGGLLEEFNGGIFPAFETNIHNSWPAVRFDITPGQDAGLTRLRYFHDWVAGLTAIEIFLVVKAVNDPSIPAGGGLNTGAPWQLCTGGGVETDEYPSSVGDILCGAGSTTRNNAGNPASSLTTKRVLNITSTATEYTIRLDGVQLFTTAVNTFAIPAFNNARFGGGIRAGIFQDYFNGWWFELIIVNRAATTQERDDTHTYLQRYDGPPPPIIPTTPPILGIFLTPEVGAKLSGTVMVSWGSSAGVGPFDLYLLLNGVSTLLQANIVGTSYNLDTTLHANSREYDLALFDQPSSITHFHGGFVIDNAATWKHTLRISDPGFPTWPPNFAGVTSQPLDPNEWGLLWPNDPGSSWWDLDDTPGLFYSSVPTSIGRKDITGYRTIHAWAMFIVGGLEQAPVWSGGLTDMFESDAGMLFFGKTGPPITGIAVNIHTHQNLGVVVPCIERGLTDGFLRVTPTNLSIGAAPAQVTLPAIDVPVASCPGSTPIALLRVAVDLNNASPFTLRVRARVTGAAISNVPALPGYWQIDHTFDVPDVEEVKISCGATGLLAGHILGGFNVQPWQMFPRIAAAWVEQCLAPIPPIPAQPPVVFGLQIPGDCPCADPTPFVSDDDGTIVSFVCT